MDKIQAFKECLNTFPLSTPARMSGISTIKGGVVITAFETDTAIVLYDLHDLERLRGILDIVIANKKE